MYSLLNHLVVCRCCLLEQPPLYTTIYDSNVSNELLTLTPNLHLAPNDGLSDVICDLCLRRVREALEFRQRCLDSERVLRARHEKWCRTVAEGEALALDDVLECLEREVGSLEQPQATPDSLAMLAKPVAFVAPLAESLDFGSLSFDDTYQQSAYAAEVDTSAWQTASSLNTPTHLASMLTDYGGDTAAPIYEANDLPMPMSMQTVDWTYGTLSPNITATATAETPVETAASAAPNGNLSTPAAADDTTATGKAKRKSGNSTRSSKLKSLHPCSECEKKFTRNFQLKLHMISVHNLGDGLRYKCDVCEKTFASRHSLRYHFKSLHSTERPFPCEHCERRFVLRTQLVSHLRTHTGEAKPRIYSCSRCKKLWPTKSDLNTHMRSHDPDMVRPFKCDRCDKAFFTRGHLSSHLLVHTGEKPYGCVLCEKFYQSVGNLNNHMARQHEDIYKAHQDHET